MHHANRSLKVQSLDIIYALRRSHEKPAWQLESNATHRRTRDANYICDNVRLESECRVSDSDVIVCCGDNRRN